MILKGDALIICIPCRAFEDWNFANWQKEVFPQKNFNNPSIKTLKTLISQLEVSIKSIKTSHSSLHEHE